MNHKEKVKLANRLYTREERKNDRRLPHPLGKFASLNWDNRKREIAERVRRHQDAAHARAVARREKKLSATN